MLRPFTRHCRNYRKRQVVVMRCKIQEELLDFDQELLQRGRLDDQLC